MAEIMIRQPHWLRSFNMFWRLVAIAALILGALGAIQDDPTLINSWRGAIMLLLICAFISAYELFERSEAGRSGNWPVPYRILLGYLIIQLVIVVLLLQFNLSFFGPLLSLMGHVCSAVPMRRWPIPLAAILVVLAEPFGVYSAIAQANWGALVGFGFSVICFIGIAAFIGVLFREQHQRDILIAELQHAKQDLERYASQAEELAALRERTRLAREMHDSLGHGLVVVNVKLEVAQRLYAVEPIRGDAELEASRVLIREMMSELRRSLANLRTPLLDHHDLSAALRRMAKEVGDRTTLTVTCTTPTNLPMIPANTAEAIWRIACEALTNVEQHAAAGSVAVALEQAHESLILRVTDDGAGITPGSETRYGHYGIIGMRERAALFGGTVQITVRPSGGTIVEAHIPIEWNSLR